MAKFLSRLGAEKAQCGIFLCIHKIEADVVQPFTMTILFKRGPQQDESNRFELTPFNREVELDQTFQRDSTFYREKNGWQKKECTLQLGYYTLDKWVLTGNCEINMGDMVSKGDVRRYFEFTGQTATENARVEVTFNISEGQLQESAGARAKTFAQKLPDNNKLMEIAENAENTVNKA